MTTTPPPGRGFSLPAVLPSLLIDGLCPYLAYTLLIAYVPGISQIMALAIGAIFPATYGLVGIVRRRHLDIIGAVVLIGIAVSMAATFVGGDPKMLLIRESFVTGALGLVCLLSLLWPRPLMFYIGRQFSTGHDAAEIERFNALWQFPGARRLFRVLTIVWGLWTLSIPQVLVISPFVFNGIFLGLITWNFAYVSRQRRRAPQPGPDDARPIESRG